MAPVELHSNAEALELARKCSAAMPDEPFIRNTLGMACYRNARYPEAEQLLLKNLDTSEKTALTLDLIMLSMIAEQQHQSAASQSFFTWAQQNYADHLPDNELHRVEIQQLFEECRSIAAQ